jgi:ABC-type branched-subunit amino acid transport system permease subunit
MQQLTAETGGKFGLLTSIYVLIYIVVGGEGKLAGPVIGTFVLTVLPEFARPMRQYQPIVFGALVVLIMFLMPQGIVTLLDRFLLRARKLLEKIRKARLVEI